MDKVNRMHNSYEAAKLLAVEVTPNGNRFDIILLINGLLLINKVSGTVKFDEAFEIWKVDKRNVLIGEFAEEWGIHKETLIKAVDKYNIVKKDEIPYLDEILLSADFDKAQNKVGGNKFMYKLALNKELPNWIWEIKQEYS